MALRSRSPWLLVPPQRRCEAWSFAISLAWMALARPVSPQRRCEAWSFAIRTHPDAHPPRQLSSTKVRSVELRNGAPSLYRVMSSISSTKVRSVELRNPIQGPFTPNRYNPQRRCEAWSFAIRQPIAGATVLASSTKVRSVELRNSRHHDCHAQSFFPQRRCEAWSFAMIGIHSRPALSCFPQRRCKAWSFAIRPSSPPTTRRPFLNEGAKRGASQYERLRRGRGVDGSSTKVRSVELRNGCFLRCRRIRRCILNEGAKRGASQYGLDALGEVGEVSSTKVRSVELRNTAPSTDTLTVPCLPQRRCEAWSFAMISPLFRVMYL